MILILSSPSLSSSLRTKNYYPKLVDSQYYCFKPNLFITQIFREQSFERKKQYSFTEAINTDQKKKKNWREEKMRIRNSNKLIFRKKASFFFLLCYFIASAFVA